jgi:integrase
MARRQQGQVIQYRGAGGVVFRARYRDASGRRVCETIGCETDGWTPRKARERLEELLVDVRREGRRRLEPTTLAAFAREWLDTYPEAKGLKRSTREGYASIVELHLIPELGTQRLDAIDVADLDHYLASKRRQGYAPRTINRHLNLLSELFNAAARRGLVRSNPVVAVDRPKEPRRHWRILSPVEVGAVVRAFEQLAAEAEEADRPWYEQARVVFLTVLGAGLRRGEILGLRWGAVTLADPMGASLRVRETFVRNQRETPKSEAGERTIALDPVLADELFQHRTRTRYQGDEERVFCNPRTGGPLDHKRYAKTFAAALAKAKVAGPMRPFHDGRHSAITNGAAAGINPYALMKRAGHSDFKTTQLYIDLAGETFREDAERIGERIFAQLGHKSGHNGASGTDTADDELAGRVPTSRASV